MFFNLFDTNETTQTLSSFTITLSKINKEAYVKDTLHPCQYFT